MSTQVLVVDDSATIRHLISDSLDDAGFSISQAKDGVEGIEQIRHGGIDCVICDLNLPRKNGLELLSELKADPKFASIPFVMLSNEGSEELVGQAKAIGASAWIVKPCKPPMIINTIKRVLQQSATEESVG